MWQMNNCNIHLLLFLPLSQYNKWATGSANEESSFDSQWGDKSIYFHRSVRTCSATHRGFYVMSSGKFLRSYSGQGVKLTASVHLVSRLKYSSTLLGALLSITHHNDITYSNGDDWYCGHLVHYSVVGWYQSFEETYGLHLHVEVKMEAVCHRNVTIAWRTRPSVFNSVALYFGIVRNYWVLCVKLRRRTGSGDATHLRSTAKWKLADHSYFLFNCYDFQQVGCSGNR